MIDYELVTGKADEVQTTVKKMLNNGWLPINITSTTIGSTIHFTQAMTRTAEESLIVEPSTTSRKLKK